MIERTKIKLCDFYQRRNLKGKNLNIQRSTIIIIFKEQAALPQCRNEKQGEQMKEQPCAVLVTSIGVYRMWGFLFQFTKKRIQTSTVKQTKFS